MRIYIDGSCRPSTGLGGYGILMIDDKGQREVITGTQTDTTNNVMELRALIEALKIIKDRQLDRHYNIEIFSDSQYVVKGVIEWWDKWKSNGFKTSAGATVKNLDLWKEIEKLKNNVRCKLTWVRGHADNKEHNEVDKIVFDLTDKKDISLVV